MWAVMLADGHVDDFEALMRKIIGLFILLVKTRQLPKRMLLTLLIIR